MAKTESVSALSKPAGSYFLADAHAVEEMYRKAGFDIKDLNFNEDEGPDVVIKVDGANYFFTGWKVTRNGEDFEFVIKLSDDFTEGEIDTIYPIDLDEEDFEDEE